MTYWKTDHFRALQQAWYRRLKAEGFQDAEKIKDGELVLAKSGRNATLRPDDDGAAENNEEIRIQAEARAAYYRLLSRCIVRERWKSDADRIILTMFADGARISAIVRALDARGIPRCRYSVRIIVRRYEQKWGMRQYTPKQLNQRVS